MSLRDLSFMLEVKIMCPKAAPAYLSSYTWPHPEVLVSMVMDKLQLSLQAVGEPCLQLHYLCSL